MALDIHGRCLARHVPNRCISTLDAFCLDCFKLNKSTALIVALKHGQVSPRFIITVNAAKGVIHTSFLYMGIEAGQLFQASNLVLRRLISRLDLLEMADCDQVEWCDNLFFLLHFSLVVAMRFFALAAVSLVT